MSLPPQGTEYGCVYSIPCSLLCQETKLLDKVADRSPKARNQQPLRSEGRCPGHYKCIISHPVTTGKGGAVILLEHGGKLGEHVDVG